MKLDFIKNQQ